MANTASFDPFAAIHCRFLLEQPTLGRLLLAMPRRMVPGGGGVWWLPQADGVTLLAWDGEVLLPLPSNQQSGWLQRAAWHFLCYHFPGQDSATAPLEQQLAADLVVSQGIAQADWPAKLPHWQHWSAWAQSQGLTWVPGQAYSAYLPLVRAFLATDFDRDQSALGAILLAALPLYVQWGQAWSAELAPPSALLAVFWKNCRARVLPALVQSAITAPRVAGMLRLLPNLDPRPSGRPWQEALHQLVGRAQATRLRPTLRRLSRRYGTAPGLQLQRLRRIAVVVDTSGSVSGELVQAFFAEIKDLWRRGIELMVVECDDRVRRTYPYRGQTIRATAGGGNTSFDPALTWCNAAERLDAVVYFTDGQAAPPQVVSRRPLLWVVALAAGQSYPNLPGRVAIWSLPATSEKLGNHA